MAVQVSIQVGSVADLCLLIETPIIKQTLDFHSQPTFHTHFPDVV